MRLLKKPKPTEDPRRYVLIPIVKPGSNEATESSSANDQLIEVYTQPYTFGDDIDNQAINKDWDRVAVTLRKVNPVLYRSGSVAAGAVRKLGLRRPKMALYQWLKPQAWLEQQRLYSSYPEGLSEGNSAELGLALVLLMAASGSHHCCVIATGALGGQTQLIREHDVRVRPVGQLAEKLKLVIQQVEKGELPRDKNLLFFIPKYCCNQEQATIEVESLPEVQTLRTSGIQVVPIEWLSEAAEKLKADTARYLPQDLILKWLMIALLVVSLSWVNWVGWRDRVISMKFVPVDPVSKEQPYIACPIGQKEEYYTQPIAQKGTIAVVPVRSTLGWQVKIGEANSFDSLISQWLGYEGYYIAFMIIAEFSELKVNDRDKQGKIIRILPKDEWFSDWTLNDKAEFNTFILLAQRTAFNSHRLKSLIESFRQTDSKKIDVPKDVTATVNFIFSQFPNGLKFMFQTIKAESQCAS